MTNEKKDFWWWFEEKEVTFTTEQVKELCEEIKKFDAGAIDPYLTNHVDKVVDKWLEKYKPKN